MSDFSLKPIEEVAELVATTTEFKTNCWWGWGRGARVEGPLGMEGAEKDGCCAAKAEQSNWQGGAAGAGKGRGR